MTKSYSELSRLKTFEERFDYLKLKGKVGSDTFGFDRVFNQMFYSSKEWKDIRNKIIARDNGCDLGVEGYEIPKGVLIYIHHINQISLDDIRESTEALLDPNNLISCTYSTHNAIHYGDKDNLVLGPVKRTKGDTCPWRK